MKATKGAQPAPPAHREAVDHLEAYLPADDAAVVIDAMSDGDERVVPGILDRQQAAVVSRLDWERARARERAKEVGAEEAVVPAAHELHHELHLENVRLADETASCAAG